MLEKEIKNIYINNLIENVYIVKRHNENDFIEEKKSSILYKDFSSFISILKNIRKYDNLLKKKTINRNGSEFSKILLDYLMFYVKNFGYKFHSFIIEFRRGVEDNDLSKCYAINDLCKTNIESIYKNNYSRVLYRYDSIKCLLVYIKKHTILFEKFSTHFKNLLIKYLNISLNPLNLLIFVYLRIYDHGTAKDKVYVENGGIQENCQSVQGVGSEAGVENTSGSNALQCKDLAMVNGDMNEREKIEDCNFFCNDLYAFICTYGEYIIRHTIISCYREIYSNSEIIKRKLKIYHWTKNSIKNCMLRKICAYAYLKKYKINNVISKCLFKSREEKLNEHIRKYKRFTEIGNGFKNVLMSSRKFSYIYELHLLLYLAKKCLNHLNENINFDLQISLYILCKSIKMTIAYLYFNLPNYMCHFFFNIYAKFFNDKKKGTLYNLKKMKMTYRNIKNLEARKKQIYFWEKTFTYARGRKHMGKKGTTYFGLGVRTGEQLGTRLGGDLCSGLTASIGTCLDIGLDVGLGFSSYPNRTEIVRTKVADSEREKYVNILDRTYFDMDNYNKEMMNIRGRELKKFLKLHTYGSVIQLKYNCEEICRKEKKRKKQKKKILTSKAKKKKKKKKKIYICLYISQQISYYE
ncbi:conserved Plasmodium protein, unknown function [Plasmodium ovale wallikeri]|uniref:Uncharacterized protein n=1 Tax=Plasmodium ovale wallikeri TaxID=864142 RepID=A0A1A8YTN1_PLAOA|nr:conserved Plasmodium protein, unknown function [Plasmodium ovale wallikeri]